MPSSASDDDGAVHVSSQEPSMEPAGEGDDAAWPIDALISSPLFLSPSLPVLSPSPPLPPPTWLFDERIFYGLPTTDPFAPPNDVFEGAESQNRRYVGIYGRKLLQKKPDVDCTDTNYVMKERLTQALRHFKESTDQHVLIQVWAPVKNGNHFVLTTSGQPFVLDPHNIGLLQYRTLSLMYMFSIDSESSSDLGLPGRVYRQKVPEWTPDVQYYSTQEYPRLIHAVNNNIHGTLALPVFEPSDQSCVAVVEVIMTSQKINYAKEVDDVCKALEAVNLKSTEIIDRPNVLICNEGRQAALVEILETLSLVCEEFSLPLAQTWVPCQHRSVLADGGGINKSCSSFDGSCMGGICMSTSDVAFHIIDAHVWGFRDACLEHHLQKGQGVAGQAFKSRQHSFCTDITQYSKMEYPLVHYARMFNLAGCFAICLQSTYTGSDEYVLEFFLPPHWKNDSRQMVLLNTMIDMMKQSFRSLRCIGDVDLCSMSINAAETVPPENGNFVPNTEGFFYDKGLEAIVRGGNVECDASEPPLDDVCGPNCNANTDLANEFVDNRAPGKKRGKAEKTISLDVLQQYFTGSLKEAAKSLGVCPTTMKRICRQHGISRWPSRKINKVTRSLSKLKHVLESVQGPDAVFDLTSITGQLSVPVSTAPGTSMRMNPAEQNDCGQVGRHASLEAGFLSNNDAVVLETGIDSPSSGSRNSSREGSNSRTSDGSCHGSPRSKLTLPKPNSSANLVQFTIETIRQEPQNPNTLVKDFGSCKDLRNLHSAVANACHEEPVLAPSTSRTVTIKASYRDDIIRFRFPSNGNVEALKDEISKRLKLDVRMFDIKYLDDDSEWVKLQCSADLEECLEISETSRAHLIRLLVSDVTVNLGSSCESSG